MMKMASVVPFPVVLKTIPKLMFNNIIFFSCQSKLCTLCYTHMWDIVRLHYDVRCFQVYNYIYGSMNENYS